MVQEWNKRISGALDVINNAAEKLKYDATHTVDGRKLKVGLKVFVLDDPTVQWSVSEIDEKIYRRKVKLESEDQEPIKRYPTKLFVSQKKTIDACIKDIKNTEAIILRDLRESLARLDANDRISQLIKLKKKL